MLDKINFILHSTSLYPSANGIAVFDFMENNLYVYVQGLPEPSFFGNDATTRQVYDTYEAWLIDKENDQPASAGWLRKLDGYHYLTFRCSKLQRYCGLRITVQDRLGSANPSPLTILEGKIEFEKNGIPEFPREHLSRMEQDQGIH